MSKSWIIYILTCKDSSLYTGITTDIEKRLKAHNEGKASKYTRARKPVRLVYSEDSLNESSARIREAEIKKLSRQEKLELIKTRRRFAGPGLRGTRCVNS